MPKISIISPSVRKGRMSHRVALYMNSLINESGLAESEILDLHEYNFPIFSERLKYYDLPSAEMIDFAARVNSADGVVIVSPEYNGGSPASLKNAIDLLTSEWKKKPVSFITVSDGSYAGTQAQISLQFTLWKLGALTLNTTLRVPDIGKSFDENGMPADKDGMDKKSVAFIKAFLLFINSLKGV